jgi:hypothetical protein
MGYKYETHMHTYEVSACARLGATAAEQVKTYKDLGYTGIIITDHVSSQNFNWSMLKQLKPMLSWKDKVAFFYNGYSNAKTEGDKCGLDVFLGWEFSYQGTADILTYGLGIDFLLNNPDLDKLPIEEYSKRVRENGGYLAQAHPYRNKNGRMLYPIDPYLLDGIEVFNAARYYKGHDKENENAVAYANFHKLPMQSGSDSHKDDRPFYSGIEMEKRAESVHDIINAIKAKEVKLIIPEGYSLEINDKTSISSSGIMIQILSDCHHAKAAVDKLRNYLANSKGLDVIVADIKDERKDDLMVRNTKKIIIGHHPSTKSRLRTVGLKYDQLGMKYGFNEHLCVLQASKSELKTVSSNMQLFKFNYHQEFGEYPSLEHVRADQFDFMMKHFIENDLAEFIKVNL